MTKIREPLSIEHTLHLLLKSVTADEVKQYTEKSISHFYKCADPDDKDHNLFLQDAIKLEQLAINKNLGISFITCLKLFGISLPLFGAVFFGYFYI